MPTPDSPISRSLSRSVKHNAVLSYARSARVFSRAQLAEHTGLSASTITHLIRELLDQGYLAEVGAGESRGGRPQSMLEFQPAAELVIVIDLHPGRLEASLLDWNGDAVAEAIIRPIVDLVDDMVAVVAEFSANHGEAVKAVAVAVPGVASGARGEVRLAPSIGLVDDQPLGELLQSRIELPVVVDNDVNLIVVGEHVAGAAQDVDDILLVHVGDGGIGAALMIDGRVRQGASGVAGEIGFLPLGQPEPPANGIGAFESRWSASAISEAAAQLIPALNGGSIIRQLEERAAEDAAARELLDSVIAAWSKAVVAVVCVLDPGRVLLSGEAAQLSERSLEWISADVARYAPGSTDIRVAAIGPRALLHGAVRRAFDAHDNTRAP